mgnify:CR=1 FL=1
MTDALSFGVHIPFVEHLGFTLHRMEAGESELRFAARPEHHNSFDVTHGGALMTLLDVAMATAARSDTPDMGVVTIEMKTSFIRPARGPMVAKGRMLERTRSMAFAEAWVYDAEGRLCSHSTGTFKYVPKAQPAAGQGAGTISTDG